MPGITIGQKPGPNGLSIGPIRHSFEGQILDRFAEQQIRVEETRRHLDRLRKNREETMERIRTLRDRKAAISREIQVTERLLRQELTALKEIN